MFLGFVQQENTLTVDVLAQNSSKTPVNLDALPGFRVYGPQGLMSGGTGTLGLAESGAITGASNANPIVITSANHGLSTGQRVTISGVGGNTNANGTFIITVIDANTFSIPVAGNAPYTSGGVWNTTGLYSLSIDAAGADGYQAGTTYTVLVSGSLSSTAWADLHSFCVG